MTTATTVALDETTNQTVTTPVFVADWPILVAWQSSDLAKFTPASAPLLPVAATAAQSRCKASMPSRTGTISDQTEATDCHPGLSAGAKVGIGVGVTLAAVVLLGIIAAFLYRRKRHQRIPQDEIPEIDSMPESRQLEDHAGEAHMRAIPELSSTE